MHLVRVRHIFYPDMPRDYFFELSKRQAEMGHRIDVVTWKKNPFEAETISGDGFLIRRLPGQNLRVGSEIAEYPFLPDMPHEIAKLAPDLVHAESHLFLSSVGALRKAKKLGIPGVLTVHGVRVQRSSFTNFAQSVYLRTLGELVFKSATRVICLTASDALEVMRYGCPRAKVRIVPNGVDSERFKPGTRPRENLVVWDGRFVPEKGLQYLIRAAKIVARDVKDVKFMLIGYGPLRNDLAALARELGLDNGTVEFAGPFDSTGIAKVLAEATIFVLPSLNEGLPVALLEAMSSGKPVVGSRVTGITEVITDEENGLVVEPRNPEMLANAIVRLLGDDGLRKRLGENAREVARSRFSWSVVLRGLEAVYEEARGEQPRRR